MTTLPIILDKPMVSAGQMPNGWWLLPSVVVGAGVWGAVLKVVFF